MWMKVTDLRQRIARSLVRLVNKEKPYKEKPGGKPDRIPADLIIIRPPGKEPIKLPGPW